MYSVCSGGEKYFFFFKGEVGETGEEGEEGEAREEREGKLFGLSVSFHLFFLWINTCKCHSHSKNIISLHSGNYFSVFPKLPQL